MIHFLIHLPSHFYRASAYWYSKSVRPSVRNAQVPDENGLTYRHAFFTIRWPNHSSFTSIKHFHKIPTGSPPAGALNTGVVYKFRDFLSISLANDTRYRHSYYRRRIGNRSQAFEWHQFQRPWVISNPNFKVTILFNVKNSKMVQDRALFTMADQ